MGKGDNKTAFFSSLGRFLFLCIASFITLFILEKTLKNFCSTNITIVEVITVTIVVNIGVSIGFASGYINGIKERKN